MSGEAIGCPTRLELLVTKNVFNLRFWTFLGGLMIL